MPHNLSSLVAVVSAFGRALHSGRAHLAKKSGLEPGTNFLLANLAKQGDMRTSELAAQACVDASVVSRQVSAIIEHGFVERVADQSDGRAFKLHLTAKGADFLKEKQQIQIEFFEQVLSDWSDADRKTLEQLLTRLVADFNREVHNINVNQEVHSVHE
jgi:DNA-binding MarR family transcriptional regulator